MILLDPVDAIWLHMGVMGWTQADLCRLTGYSPPRVSEFLNRKRKLTIGFIRAYHRVDSSLSLDVLIRDYKL